MRYDDIEVESYNLEVIPGRGDSDPILFRTRSFILANQCEYGSVFDLEQSHMNMMLRSLDLYGEPHWSDPEHYPC